MTTTAVNNELSWVNPVGGLGDTIMISSVLKMVKDRYPDQEFNLVTRSSYSAMLAGHPAIVHIGYPPKDANIKPTAYWDSEPLGPGSQRAFQILARMFGLETPVPEDLYLPGECPEDKLLWNFIPWRRKNVMIAPFSASPRKAMHPSRWHHLVDLLKKDSIFVAQTGELQDTYIRNAYSLLGLTTPHQLIALLPLFDVVVTSDSFVMHAAHLMGVPAVVLWGPTSHEVYGYEEQVHLAPNITCKDGTKCIGPQNGHLYATPCPHEKRHCVDNIDLDEICLAVKDQLC